MRGMPTMKTELQDKGSLKLIKDFQLMNRLSIIMALVDDSRSRDLELEAPDVAMLLAMGLDIRHLLKIWQSVSAIKNLHSTHGNRLVGDPRMDQCTTYGRVENAGVYFRSTSELPVTNQTKAQASHQQTGTAAASQRAKKLRLSLSATRPPQTKHANVHPCWTQSRPWRTC